MQITVTTKYSSHPTSGAGRIVAKGAGKQKTLPYNHRATREENHADAAASLFNRVVPTGSLQKARHSLTYSYDAARNAHKYTVTV